MTGAALPDCHGCDKCGDAKENALYSHQHDGRYLCSKCFFTTAPGQRWPVPPGPQEDDVEAKDKVKLAEKVFEYIEKNIEDPKKIQSVIDRYREKSED